MWKAVELLAFSFTWAGSAWWIEVLLGVGLAASAVIFRAFFSEGLLCQHPALFVLAYALCAVGAWRALTLEFTPDIDHGIALIIGFGLYLLCSYAYHVTLREEIEADSRRFWFLRKYKARDGYFETSKREAIGNAFASRFGIVVIGRSPKRTFWQWLTRRDGWTDTQRGAILRHEIGHNLIAVPAIAIETLLYYYFWAFVLRDVTWSAILLVPALLAAVTVLSWAEELFCDLLSGLPGFSLYSVMYEGTGVVGHFTGSVGAGSHPPLILRAVAYLALPLAPLGLVAGLVYWLLVR